jgi:hypothetical protein
MFGNWKKKYLDLYRRYLDETQEHKRQQERLITLEGELNEKVLRLDQAISAVESKQRYVYVNPNNFEVSDEQITTKLRGFVGKTDQYLRDLANIADSKAFQYEASFFMSEIIPQHIAKIPEIRPMMFHLVNIVKLFLEVLQDAKIELANRMAEKKAQGEASEAEDAAV